MANDENYRSDLLVIDSKLNRIITDVRSIKDSSVMGEDMLLDFHDVCQILHLSERQVRRLRESGELKGFLIGKRRLYRKSELMNFINEREKRKEESYGKYDIGE